MNLRRMLPLWVLGILVPGTAMADPPATPPQPAAETEGAPAAAIDGKGQDGKQEAQKAGQPAQGSVFTDRDGDGIQDGQEHRFRKRPRHRTGTTPENGTGSREMRRLRLGPGHGGEGPGGDGKRGEMKERGGVGP
ncbi:hypothetical protein KBD49_09405 [Myxococcota bacterium]|nr:hypothetical protein [Myxococcota bacterium]